MSAIKDHQYQTSYHAESILRQGLDPEFIQTYNPWSVLWTKRQVHFNCHQVSMNKDKYTSIVRTSNVDHHRKRIGLDEVIITPMDKHDMCLLLVILMM